jgi:hypothetical protein
MRTILTGDDVDLAYQSGKKEIHVQPDDIITSIAKEKAEKHGIRFVAHEGIHPTELFHRTCPAAAGKPGTFIALPPAAEKASWLLGPAVPPMT